MGTDPERSVRIEEIGPEAADAWHAVLSGVWPMNRGLGAWYARRMTLPGWRHYLALMDGRPAAAAATYVKGDVARLAEAVTLSHYRRRGIHAALIRRRSIDGIEAGVRLFTTETNPPLPRMRLVSYRNMLRAGFQLAYVRPACIWAADA